MSKVFMPLSKLCGGTFPCSGYRVSRAGKINDVRVFYVFERLLLAQDPRLPVGISVGHASYR